MALRNPDYQDLSKWKKSVVFSGASVIDNLLKLGEGVNTVRSVLHPCLAGEIICQNWKSGWKNPYAVRIVNDGDSVEVCYTGQNGMLP